MIHFFKPKPVARVALSMKPARGPWGGSSTFAVQLIAVLRKRGYEVCFDLKGHVDLIVIIDPRVDNRLKKFGPDEIAAYRVKNPQVRVVHRVNECDQRKGSAFMDALLAGANRHADYTVFIAEWLREYHSERWFDSSLPHSVIYNGADEAVFHPIGSRPWKEGEPLRLVTHHWSNHALKGFDVYEEVDRLIHAGELPGFELWVIGRWPENLVWKSARTFTPLSGRPLAEMLRRCHLYLTATRFEPCGMHHVEGAQCGLPLAYHQDGGGVVEAGQKYGLGFRDNVKECLLEMRSRYPEFRQRVLERMPSGERMSFEFANLIQKLIAVARENPDK